MVEKFAPGPSSLIPSRIRQIWRLRLSASSAVLVPSLLLSSSDLDPFLPVEGGPGGQVGGLRGSLGPRDADAGLDLHGGKRDLESGSLGSTL